MCCFCWQDHPRARNRGQVIDGRRRLLMAVLPMDADNGRGEEGGARARRLGCDASGRRSFTSVGDDAGRLILLAKRDDWLLLLDEMRTMCLMVTPASTAAGVMDIWETVRLSAAAARPRRTRCSRARCGRSDGSDSTSGPPTPWGSRGPCGHPCRSCSSHGFHHRRHRRRSDRRHAVGRSVHHSRHLRLRFGRLRSRPCRPQGTRGRNGQSCGSGSTRWTTSC